MLKALRRFNPEVPEECLQQALAEITAPTSHDAITENHCIHGYLVDGCRGVTCVDSDGQEMRPTIRLIGTDPAENDYLAVNQVTIATRERTRRFDVVLCCNGMSMAIIELKQVGSRRADLAAAHAQLQTYLAEFPVAFRLCAIVQTESMVSWYAADRSPPS